MTEYSPSATVQQIQSHLNSTFITSPEFFLRIAALAFFVVPLVEMVILIQVGSAIGALPTIGLVILTAVCGIWLLRMEGIATLHRVQQKLDRGELPDTELLEGVMLIIGGTLLLTPGFVTDAIGFICLLPGLRRPIASTLIRSGSFSTFQTFTSRTHRGPGGPGGTGGTTTGTTIDGEYREENSHLNPGDSIRHDAHPDRNDQQ